MLHGHAPRETAELYCWFRIFLLLELESLGFYIIRTSLMVWGSSDTFFTFVAPPPPPLWSLQWLNCRVAVEGALDSRRGASRRSQPCHLTLWLWAQTGREAEDFPSMPWARVDWTARRWAPNGSWHTHRVELNDSCLLMPRWAGRIPLPRCANRRGTCQPEGGSFCGGFLSECKCEWILCASFEQQVGTCQLSFFRGNTQNEWITPFHATERKNAAECRSNSTQISGKWLHFVIRLHF